MSRNLCQTDCAFCGSEDIVLEEEARPITPDEAGPYFDEYRGCLFANAHCAKCEAPYLAWMDDMAKAARYHYAGRRLNGKHFDLSHRAAFNDEPQWPEDAPKWKIEKRVTVEWINHGPWDAK